jgi:hypothetical protein
MTLHEDSSRWNAVTKIAFRFFFVYFIVYIFPFPLNWIPFSEPVWKSYFQFWYYLANLLESIIQGLAYNHAELPMPGGSGDTTFNYLLLLIFVFIAFISCLIWSFFDWKRNNYQYLLRVLNVYLRYYWP